MTVKIIRFKFGKIGVYKYLSHLDIINIIIRALRRADIRVKYTEGFNPKPKITFSPPIPLGVESAAEYADAAVICDITLEEFVETMNRELEGRIAISGAKEVPPGVKSLMSQVDIAEYAIEVGNGSTNREALPKYISRISRESGIEDSIYDIKIEGSGPDEGNSIIVLYGYTKTLKDRNKSIFKFRGFSESLKCILEDNGMKIISILKKELFILREGEKLTPFEVLGFYV